MTKIDLTLMKKLLGELETSLNTSDAIKTAEGSIVEYIVEMSKSLGLASGMVQEASLLIADIQAHVMSVQNPQASKSDFLSKILGAAPPKGGDPTAN